jgi:hypothetical protein
MPRPHTEEPRFEDLPKNLVTDFKILSQASMILKIIPNLPSGKLRELVANEIQSIIDGNMSAITSELNRLQSKLSEIREDYKDLEESAAERQNDELRNNDSRVFLRIRWFILGVALTWLITYWTGAP